MQLPLVGYILTKDEEDKIETAVRSLRRVTDVVVVVDSCSTDRTAEVAEAAGATVWHHPFESFAKQRNWALDEIATTLSPEWIFALDADEVLDDALVEDLNRRLDNGGLDADLYLVHRRVKFDGRLLRWGGFANTRVARLHRTGRARYEDRPVNEHLSLLVGSPTGTLEGAIVHADVSSWERYIEKHNRYSTLEAEVRLQVAHGVRGVTLGNAIRRRDLRRRWVRERLWNRAPSRPALRFAQLYLLMGGILDGRAGFRRALFEAWQEMCTDLKVEELRSRRKG